jgi:enamine deaminase RidA (YjgF/YER057c/UK114 family)
MVGIFKIPWPSTSDKIPVLAVKIPVVATSRLLILPLCLVVALGAFAQKRKNRKDQEPKPQVLDVLPEPPEAVTAETGRLSFQLSPLSAKGLLSEQVRNALKALSKSNHGGTIVKLRAFVAGSGDLRRVKDIVAEEFSDKKQPLPAVTTVQVGALPIVGAQVVLEAISMDKKIINPNGLAFFSASSAPKPAASMAQLQASVKEAGVKAPDILRVTCFLSSLDMQREARTAVLAAFPAAAATFVQMQRLGIEPQAACEAVGRLSAPPSAPVVLTNHTALVNAPKLVLTGAQLVFRDQDSDFQLAFRRLGKSIGELGATFQDVVWTGVYSLTRPDIAKIENIQWQFLDRSHPPAGAALQFEGLPALDATAAIEFVAIAH